MQRTLLFTLALWAAGVAFAADRVAPAIPPPLADHHQHLQSPATAALTNRTAAEIAVPPAIATLLRERERVWNDASGLRKLFTEDAQVFTGANPGWADAVRGAGYLGSRFARPYRLTPTTLRMRDAQATIGGYYTRGEGADTSRIGYFQLVLERDARDAWRIASEVPVFPGPTVSKVEDARDLIRYLDAAGIRRAVVLSDAYYFDSPKNDVTDRREKVRRENDWTAAQVAAFPDRLVAFCSFNPLAEWAIEELERCAGSGGFTGIKLHFGTSAIDLRNPAHVDKVRAVVAAANRRGMPLIVHVRPDPKNYGAEDARVLLERIVSAAPDVPFQIAHLWGGEAFSADALQVYAEAVARGDPVARHLYFDIAEAALVVGDRADVADAMVRRMREIGLDRILYATDGPVEESQAPADGWKATQKLPLTAEELRRIARNLAPYLAKRPKPLK